MTATVSAVMKDIIIPYLKAGLDWFTKIINAVEGKGFYIAMVFIALVGGFLLSRFGVGISLGSDVASKTFFAVRTAKERRAEKQKDAYEKSIVYGGRSGRK